MSGTLLLLALASPVRAQDRDVVLNGQVIDASSLEPLRGALVMAPLSERSVLTDTLGEFSVRFIRDRAYQLVAGAIGYESVGMTLGPEAAEASIAIHLIPDPEALAALAVLRERLEERRRQTRRSRRIRLFEAAELATSPEESAYDLVRRIAIAQPCRDQRDLCRLGGRRVRLCIDDANPGAGSRELEVYEPSDLWLIESFDDGRTIRVYSRWFIEQTVRTRQGELRFNPIC